MKITKGKLDPNKPLKRVLIITYYWPPAGGSGVQRWLKFAKYLPENGWQPVVFCPDNADYTVYDESLAKDIPPEAEIIRAPIFEPYRFFRKITGQKEVIGTGLSSTGEGKSPSWLKKLMIWVRGNLFIPDARMFWIRPSVKRLLKYLEDNPVDSMVSTGPPHSCHLIALGIKKKISNLRWVADFRDPWSNIDFMQDLNPTVRVLEKHKALEKKVLDATDHVVVVTPTMQKELQALTLTEVDLVVNGYDPEDFEAIDEPLTDIYTLSHVGTMPASRNPDNLWLAIKQAWNNEEINPSNYRVRLIGHVDSSIKESIIKQGIEEFIEYIDAVDHKTAIRYMKSSYELLLVINNSPNAKGILTGKVFEYLATQRPILAIGPENSDIETLTANIPHVSYYKYQDLKNIKRHVEQIKESNSNDFTNKDNYSRKKQIIFLKVLLDKA